MLRRGQGFGHLVLLLLVLLVERRSIAGDIVGRRRVAPLPPVSRRPRHRGGPPRQRWRARILHGEEIRRALGESGLGCWLLLFVQWQRRRRETVPSQGLGARCGPRGGRGDSCVRHAGTLKVDTVNYFVAIENTFCFQFSCMYHLNGNSL